MRDALVQVYLHFVWGTWNRLPIITKENETIIYEAILGKCKTLNTDVIALGGTEDHMHILVLMPSTITIADFIKYIKGSTSHLITHQINSEEFFKWQGSYAAFSVSVKDLKKIKTYIHRQKEHHSQKQTFPEFELEAIPTST